MLVQESCKPPYIAHCTMCAFAVRRSDLENKVFTVTVLEGCVVVWVYLFFLLRSF